MKNTKKSKNVVNRSHFSLKGSSGRRMKYLYSFRFLSLSFLRVLTSKYSSLVWTLESRWIRSSFSLKKTVSLLLTLFYPRVSFRDKNLETTFFKSTVFYSFSNFFLMPLFIRSERGARFFFFSCSVAYDVYLNWDPLREGRRMGCTPLSSSSHIELGTNLCIAASIKLCLCPQDTEGFSVFLSFTLIGFG